MGAEEVAGVAPAGRYGRGGELCPVLVGRLDVLALADRRLAAALRGAGELLFLAGEAGIGKTRLLTEIADRAAGLGFSVVAAGAFPGDTEVAGGLLADLGFELRRLPGRAAAGTWITERLRQATEGDRTGEGDGHRQRRVLATELAQTLVSVGTAGPVLIALEDLHWADDLTLEVLDRAARQLTSQPILVVGSYRSDELYPRVPMRAWRTRLLTQRLAEEVRLPRLGPDDTAAMVAAIRGAVLPVAVSGTVFARSDGIPLHVEEFLATVVDADPRAEVPDTLAEAVRTRALLLPASARELAGAASVIGRSFDVDLLTAVAGAEPAVVDAGLRELTDRFFVQPRHDRSGYDFRHSLIREALYADLTPHRRRDLHARAADAASAAGLGDAFISDQYERAHRPADAYRHALAGAADAIALSAHREAVELFRRAQRTTPVDTRPADRAAVLAALAAELAAIDDNTAAAAAYTEAYSLYRGLHDDLAAAGLVPQLVAVRHLLGASLDERIGLLREALSLIASQPESSTQDIRARIHAGLAAAYMLDRRLDEAITDGELARSLGDQSIGWNIDATLGSVLVFAGRMDEGWRLLDEAITRATGARAEAEAARGHRMRGSCASVLVEYAGGLRWLREGIAYAERAERFNDRHYLAGHLAHVLWATGDWTAADTVARTALTDGGGGVTTRIIALHVLGYLALGRSDWPAAQLHLTEAADLGAQMRELQRVSPAWWGLAEAALHRGNPAEAISWCERGYTASAEVRDAAYLFPFVLTGVRAFLGLDNATGARDWFHRTGDLLRQRAIPGTLIALDHAQGLLSLHDGQTGRARELLEGAAAGWAGRQRFWEGTQAILDQSRCAARSRRPGPAAELAQRARAQAAAAGATTLVEAADRTVAAGAPHLPGTPSVLTAREVEVAHLVAAGATNREIAQALSIAPKTVAAHIEHILTKLGASRRTQIAAWATERKIGA